MMGRCDFEGDCDFAIYFEYTSFQTYFYQEENLLSGLSLSRENLTVRPEYEEILVFYGYDLQPINVIFHQPHTEAPLETTTEAETTTKMIESTTTTEEQTTEAETTSTTT